jgi:two-component system, OmpR family, phosphate regulon response regulator PhoB
MPSVLVVDDEPVIRALVRASLEHSGWQVREAVDGEEALAASTRDRPDVILLDAALPKVPGIEVCRRLRQVADTSDIPVVLLSGFIDEAQAEAAQQAGATGFVAKPFTPSELIEEIEQVVP